MNQEIFYSASKLNSSNILQVKLHKVEQIVNISKYFQVSKLKDKLSADHQALTNGERIRREGIVDSLSRKEKDLKELVSKTSFPKVDANKRNLFKKPVPGNFYCTFSES